MKLKPEWWENRVRKQRDEAKLRTKNEVEGDEWEMVRGLKVIVFKEREVNESERGVRTNVHGRRGSQRPRLGLGWNAIAEEVRRNIHFFFAVSLRFEMRVFEKMKAKFWVLNPTRFHAQLVFFNAPATKTRAWLHKHPKTNRKRFEARLALTSL
jgi:hypothetical protein